jgi:hypothetical protein
MRQFTSNFKTLFTIFFFLYSTFVLGAENIIPTRVLQSQNQWLNKIQLENGAIPMTAKSTDTTGEIKIVPYFANIAARGMLEQKGNETSVRRYLDWYFNHLNHKDKDGLSGTVYDYRWNLVTKKEKATNDYDSVDSYGATFLTLLRAYYEKTGDKEYLLNHQKQILEITNSISAVTHQEMTFAKASYKVKYLMDNCEVYAGWRDAAWLFEKVFADKKKATFYQHKADNLQKALESSLWDEKKQHYSPGMFETGKKLPFDWKNFYPDAASQLYPIWTGLISPDSPKAKYLYTTFCQHYPQWDSLLKPDPFPWAVIAYTATKMGDDKRINTFMQHIHRQYGLKHYPWPWYCMEAGMTALTAGELKKGDGK